MKKLISILTVFLIGLTLTTIVNAQTAFRAGPDASCSAPVYAAGTYTTVYTTDSPNVFLVLNTVNGELNEVIANVNQKENLKYNIFEGDGTANSKGKPDTFMLLSTHLNNILTLFNRETGEIWFVRWSENPKETFCTQPVKSPFFAGRPI